VGLRVGYLLWAVAGALALYLLQRDPPAPDYPSVIVHREAIERTEPDTVVRTVEKLRYIVQSPDRVAVAPGGATGTVAAFCAPSIVVAAGDTAARPAPRLLLRSGAFQKGLWLARDRLTLTGPTSYGDLVQGTWATRGSFNFVVAGDSVLVRRDRWAFPKQLLQVGVWAGLGYGVGRLF
jgi:hypothetical protein